MRKDEEILFILVMNQTFGCFRLKSPFFTIRVCKDRKNISIIKRNAMPIGFKFQSISPRQVGILGRKTNAGSSGPDLWSKLSLTSTRVVPPGGIFSSTQEGPWRRIVSTMNRAFNRKKGKQIQPTNVWANKRGLFLARVCTVFLHLRGKLLSHLSHASGDLFPQFVVKEPCCFPPLITAQP